MFRKSNYFNVLVCSTTCHHPVKLSKPRGHHNPVYMRARSTRCTLQRFESPAVQTLPSAVTYLRPSYFCEQSFRVLCLLSACRTAIVKCRFRLRVVSIFAESTTMDVVLRFRPTSIDRFGID